MTERSQSTESRSRPATGSSALAPASDLLDARLVAVVVLAALLRLYGLGAESLWTDELITWGFLHRNAAYELLYVIPLRQPHLPVYYVGMDLWMSAFGTDEAVLRFPAAVFGVATVALTYRLGAALFDRDAGLVAAALLAVSRFHVQHSMELRMYSLLTMLAVASTLLYVRLRTGGTRRLAAAYAFVTLLLVFTHPFAVFVPLGQAVFHVGDVARGRRAVGAPGAFDVRGLPRRVAGWRPMRQALAATWLVAGPVLAALVWKLSDTTYHYVAAPTPRHVVNTVATIVGLIGTTVTVGLGLAIVGGLAGLAVLADLRRPPQTRGFDRRFGPALLLVACFVAPLLCNFLLSLAFTPLFWPRYVIAAAPPLVLLVGGGASVLAGAVRPTAAVAVVVVLLVLLAGPVADLHTTTEREQWREAGAVVDEHGRAGDVVLVADAISEEGMQHYVDREGVVVKGVFVAESGTGNDPDTGREIREKAAGHDRVWLTVSHASDAEEERVVAALAEERPLVEEWSFVGVDLYLFGEPGADSASLDDEFRNGGHEFRNGARSPHATGR